MRVARALAMLPIAGCLSKPSFEGPCPTGYELLPGAGTLSRYRFSEIETDFAGAQLACELDDPEGGRTYLVALDTRPETEALDAFLQSLPAGAPTRFWVGAEQEPGRLAPELGWRLLGGGMLPIGLWGGGEPNDADGVENDEENVASLNPFDASGYLADVDTFATGRVALCECGPTTQ